MGEALYREEVLEWVVDLCYQLSMFQHVLAN